MIRDVIERFSYRFQLWRRQELPDYAPYSDAAPSGLVEKLAEDPKRRVILTEPTVMFVGRFLVSYFGIVGIVALLCRIGIAFFPSARGGIIVGLIAFACLWAFGLVGATFKFSRARRDYRDGKII